jgi:hypothetical protein
LNAGEGARELREEEEPLEDMKAGAELRKEREEEEEELARFGGCFFMTDGADHSLSVAGEPGSSLGLVEESETIDAEDEAELAVSFWSFSSKSMKMRERASLYAAVRSSIVLGFLLAPAELRPPMLPVSEASTSDTSPSSPVTDPVCERGVRIIILNLSGASAGAGASSANRRGGLPPISAPFTIHIAWNTYIRLSWVARTLMALVAGSVSGTRP